MDRIVKRAVVFGFIVGLLCAVLFLVRERFLLAIGDFLVLQDELLPADVIVVTSGPNCRADYGIQLYQHGYGKRIFFTKGACPARGEAAQYGKKRAAEMGVAPNAIAFNDSRVTSTYSEAVKVKAFITESPAPVRSVIVVSDPYHMWRVRWAFRQVLGDGVSLHMAPVPFDLSANQRLWWTDDVSRRLVTGEYVKIAYYFARYKFSRGPFKEWLASFDQG